MLNLSFAARCLTPEEDAIADPDEVDDDIDDTLPADLWFRRRGRHRRASYTPLMNEGLSRVSW
ncbi:MAG: hypothetical protein IT337_15330 [Thermomicrobiales bacterium]|nr:hypothetical protein [Thermomicrobiales bacterium]